MQPGQHTTKPDEFFDDPDGATCLYCNEHSTDPNHAANCSKWPSKWSHQYLVAFTVISEEEDGREVSPQVLLTHLLKRAAEIAEEIAGKGTEAFQCEDSEPAE